MEMRGLRSARALRAASALGLLAGALLDCSQTPTAVPLRSLERSGKLSLLCLDPVAGPQVGYSLDDCQARRAATKAGGSGQTLKLFSLVNQTTRGEVAMLNLTDSTVFDADPSTPGFNFLPIGSEPVDIVTTPESTASFVATAEVSHQGIYALPSTRILAGRPTIRSWPACSLPSRPGSMAMLVSSGEATCASPSFATDTLGDKGNPAHPQGDLSLETQQPGVRKLLVAMPSEGDLLVIDAQKLLDRTPGSFDPCPIERRLKLNIELPATTTLPAGADADQCPLRPASTASPICPVRGPQTVTYQGDFKTSPSAFAQAENRVYISDSKAPVIHVLDLTDPCSPVEQAPLLPSSFDNPSRPVFTSSLAVSPVTSDGKRYVYAVDAQDGSVMIFDVSEGSGQRTPLTRSRPEYFPFSPRDRLNLGAPVQQIIFVSQEYYYDLNGSKVGGIVCDPTTAYDANAPTAASSYQTATDFSDGARPSRLRGTFALAALTSGQVAVIDVDDYDAKCRQYNDARYAAGFTTDQQGADAKAAVLPDWQTGCDTVCSDDKCTSCNSTATSFPGASGEASCRVVVPHELRSRYHISSSTNVGSHQPGFVSFPILNYQGSALATNSTDDGLKHPRLLGPASGSSNVSIGKQGLVVSLSPNPSVSDNNYVLADIREPRAAIDQSWALTYEGVIPGFGGKVGRLTLGNKDPKTRGLIDSSGGFCYRGVHDEDAARVDGLPFYPDRTNRDGLDSFAKAHADWLEITSDILDESDPYWSGTSACSYVSCRATFGLADTPTAARSIRIREAYQDRLLLGPDGSQPYLVPDATTPVDPNNPDKATAATLDPGCCFPTMVTYQVRGGATWIAAGGVSGFIHHTTIGDGGRCIDQGIDPQTGVVCDPSFATRTGRAFEVPNSPAKPDIQPHDGAYTFHNPNFFSVVYAGAEPSRRDMAFVWQMSGGFVPLEINVGVSSIQVAPQAMYYHPVLNTEVLVTDGALQGVVTIDLGTLAVNRDFL
jgi:hypothetical protein